MGAILTTLAINAGIYVLSWLARRVAAEFADGKKPGELQLPTTDQRIKLPLAYGRVLCRQPLTLDHGDMGYRTFEVNGNSDNLRTDWFASVRYALFANNVIPSDDQNNYPEFVRLWLDDQPMNNMFLEQVDYNFIFQNPQPGVRASWDQYLTSPYAHGITRDEGWGSRVMGAAVFTRGAPDDLYDITFPNTQLQLYYNRVTSTSETDGSNVEQERGVATLLLTNMPFITNTPNNRLGFFWGNSPSLPRPAVEAVNPVAIPDVNPSLMEINGGDANPAGVLYDILVNDQNGRLGYPAAVVDVANFGQVALQLWVEQIGFSRLYEAETEVKNIIKEIEALIDGVAYIDPVTGLWKIQLIRDDYSIPALPHFHDTYTDEPANIEEGGVVNYETANWDGLPNRIQVSFTARTMAVQDFPGITHEVPAFKTQVAETTAQASAAEEGAIEPVERQYPGCSNRDLAARLLTRDLRALSLPLTRATLNVSRKAYFYHRGMVVKATSRRWGGETIVFRVVDVDLGEDVQGTITLDLLQDRFAVNYTMPDAIPYPPVIGPTNVPPAEPADQAIEEVPWFWTNLGADLGAFSDRQRQRMWYLAGPTGNNLGYVGGIKFGNDPTFVDDTGRIVNLPTCTVAVAYDRENEPYDTTVGLLVEGLVGMDAFDSATAQDIRRHGFNTIWLNEEILAFEDAVFMDETQRWHLTNVWRALAGTAPRTHAVGGTAFFLGVIQIARAPGNRGVTIGDEVATAVSGVTASGRSVFTGTDSDIVRRRLWLPGTVADLKLGDQTVFGVALTPAKVDMNLVQEGVYATYKARDRENVELVRGDVAAETQPEAETSFNLVVVYSDETVNAASSGSSLTGFGPSTLSRWGWGAWRVGVQSVYGLDFGGETVEMTSWQIPLVEMQAWEFRSLVMNHAFVGSSTTFWVEGTGDIVASGSGPTWLSTYITGDGTDTSNDWSQTIDIEHWRSARMQALLEFFVKSIAADTNDTVRVDLYTLDAGLSIQDTQTYGPSTPAASWEHQVLTVPSIDADTRYVRIRIRQTAVDPPEPDSALSAVISGFILRVGQITAQLLANPDFESGLTGWTVSLGDYTDETTNAKVGTHRIQGGANATNTAYQEVSLTAGWNVGSRAVAEASTYHPGPGNGAGTATLLVEARASAGGTVLASHSVSQSSVEGAYVPLLAHCDVPVGTTIIRTTLSGVRTAGSGSNQVSWDDCSLRLHKRLDPLFERVYDFVPTVQDVPTSLAEWQRAFPEVTAPSIAMLSPAGHGLGTEPLLQLRGQTRVAKVHGVLGSDDQKTRLGWQTWQDEAGGITVRSPTVGAFDGAADFSIRLVFDLRYDAFGSGPVTLARRLDTDTGQGWTVGINADGAWEATLQGLDGTATCVVSDGTVGPGPQHLVLTYDVVAEELRLYSWQSSDTASTAGIGSVLSETFADFALGYDPDGSVTNTPSMVLLALELFGACLTSGEVAMLWTHGRTQGQPGTVVDQGVQAGNAAVATVVGEDADGVIVGYHGYLQVPHGMDSASEWGLANARVRGNKVNSNMATIAGWTYSDLGGVIRPGVQAPDGGWDTVSVIGNSGHHREVSFVAGGDGPRNVVFFAKTSGDFWNMRLRLLETDGTLLDTEDFLVTGSWQRVDLVVSGWVGGTTNAVLRFIPSTDGTNRTIYLSGPFLCDGDGSLQIPTALPYVGEAETRFGYEGLGLSRQFNHEGEIEVHCRAQYAAQESGTLVELTGASLNDKRSLYLDASAALFDHYDGAATVVTSTPAPDDWTENQVVRARWQRAGLLEGASIYAGVRTNNESDYGRTAIWTPGASDIDVITIGEASEVLIKQITLRGREKIL